MKRLLLGLSIILLCAVAYIAYSPVNSNGGSELPDASNGVQNESSSEGSLRVILVSGENLGFSKAFTVFSKGLSQAGMLSIEALSYSGFLKLISQNDPIGSKQFTESDIVLFSPGIIPAKDELMLLELKKIPSIMFSELATDLCLQRDEHQKFVSKYAWNFDVAINTYVESFLSFINEQYGKVGYELPILVYVNNDPRLVKQGRILSNAIQALGLKLSGQIVVDERIKDLYPTLRNLFSYTARVIISVMTERGASAFYPVADKLGMSFEMGMVDISPGSQDRILKFGKSTKQVMVPMPYLADLPSDSNKAFVSALQNEGVETGLSSYRAYLSFKFIDLSVQAMRSGIKSASAALESIDGKRFDGPSGLVTVHEQARGLIQPMYIAEVRDGGFHLRQNLGDMTQSVDEICSVD